MYCQAGNAGTMGTAVGEETAGLNNPGRYSPRPGNAGMVIRGATAIIKDRRLLYRPAFSGEGLIDVLA